MTTDLSPAPSRRGRPPAKLQRLIRGRLLDAAWRVLVEEGFEGFSIDKVARRAHASKATLYARFGSKTELLHAALEQELERSIFIFPRYEPDEDLASSLVDQCVASLRQLASDEGRMIERLVEWLDAEGSERTVRNDIYERALRNTAQFIADASRDGQLHGSEMTARLWVEGILGHCRFLCGREDIDWKAEHDWACAFVAYHLGATGYGTR